MHALFLKTATTKIYYKSHVVERSRLSFHLCQHLAPGIGLVEGKEMGSAISELVSGAFLKSVWKILSTLVVYCRPDHGIKRSRALKFKAVNNEYITGKTIIQDSVPFTSCSHWKPKKHSPRQIRDRKKWYQPLSLIPFINTNLKGGQHILPLE